MRKNDRQILYTIGENVRKLRKSKGITQEQLAYKLGGMSKNFVSELELGKSGISITNVIRLCEGLNLQPNDIFTGTIYYNDENNDFIVNKLSRLSKQDRDFFNGILDYFINTRN